jgi:TolB protein
MTTRHFLIACVLAGATVLALPPAGPGGVVAQTLPQQTAAPLPQQQSEVKVTITGANGAKPRLAVPEFTVVGGTPELQQAAKTISTVLWDDLDFEEEYYMIPRDTAAKVPAAATPEALAYERWSELGADAVLFGTVRPAGAGLEVDVQLMGIRGEAARKQAFGNRYNGCTLKSPRFCAHYISDDFYKKQRGLDGVARTRLAFSSDRSDLATGRVSGNASQEIYIADYDGANPQRITANRSLNIMPTWAPDGRSLAYASYVTNFPDIYLQSLSDIKLTKPAGGTDVIHNQMPAWSPDGSKIAFASRRGAASGFNIYVTNRDGSNLQQLTNSQGDNVSPAWSPSGSQIVFTSGRSGQPQLYVIGADGTGLQRLPCGEQQCDRPTWSAATNKIAYTCGTTSGYDICLLDMGSMQVIKITDGLGSNEQPSFAPNGRHVVFVTTRWGKSQLAMADIRGTVSKRRITEIGNNKHPSWSRTPQ